MSKITLYLEEPSAYATMQVDGYDIMEVSDESGRVVVEMADGAKFAVKNKIQDVADAMQS